MIGSVNTGGGATAFAFIVATYPVGSTCTCTCTETGKVLRAKDTSGSWVFDIPYAGTWIVSTDASHSKSVNIISEGSSIGVSILLPNIYQQVEYLASTGTQYLDSEVKATGKTIVHAKYIVTAWSSGNYTRVFGTEDSTQNYKYRRALQYYPNTNQMRATYGGDTGVTSEITGYSALNTVYKFEDRGDEVYVNDTLVASRALQSYTTSFTVAVFSTKSASNTFEAYGSKRIYDFRMVDNDVIICHLVPCYRISDHVAGMYDVANSRFETNKGSGTFTVGGDVA